MTRSEEEPVGASGIAYSLADLHAMESAIADNLVGFLAARDGEQRSGWLSSHFGPRYPADATEREVIEDIVSRVFNDRFTAIFRCPACKRIALHEDGADPWVFYRAEAKGQR